jgi:tRNA pseudouridine55 synthase
MAFYLIDKPAGITSADVIRNLKKSLDVEKIGHGGTLDPFATGLLIVATGGHTRLLSVLLGERKTYEGVITFNQTTETLDPESELIKVEEPVEITEDDVRIVANEKFLGSIMQTPPRYSSIKVNGKKAYDLARAGVDFQLEPVARKIYSFDVKHLEGDSYKFKVEVSSGTYIRALARDLGNALGTKAMLTELRRIKVGNSSIEDATDMDNPKELGLDVVLGIESIEVSKEQMTDFMNGKTVKVDMDIPKMSFIATNGDLELYVTSKSLNNYKIKRRIK